MIKFKHILWVAIVGAILYACGSDSNNTVTPFDHEAQASKDNDTIVKFLKAHYYDDTIGIDSIRPITDGSQIALIDDNRLETIEVNEYDLDYKYYVFVKHMGDDPGGKGFPSVVDSVLTKYKLRGINKSDEVSNIQDLNKATWFDPKLIAVRGWLYGFTHFKGGLNITNNGPITYFGGGKGFFLLPSGLSYRNGGALANTNLLYYIDLYDIVENTDSDLDGVPSKYEDIDEDGKPWNDNTDGDFSPNFIDVDDDGDGVLTKYEDANKDGDPRNDFSDPNKPTVPDYLNKDIRKSTK